ncbi:hypothetical protein [Mucilaginibacter antarcticus]|uniref:hypothetical protein n=1 Tax=Mucilaginibacter antarcticus TaxID=1855725 RepID=UPI003640EF22
MQNHPFNTTNLNDATVKRFADTYQALKDEFDIQPTGHIDFDLQQFEVFKNCAGVNVLGSFVIKRDCGDSYILFVEVKYKIGSTPQANHQEHQVWGLTYVKHSFGRVLIRRETLTDKLLELVHPLELNFDEDKPFCNTFFVVVNDYVKATGVCTAISATQ